MTGALDRITLLGLRVFAHHGVYPDERQAGQEFVIDLTVEAPLAVAARSDDVQHTVHYGDLAEAVMAAVRAEPVDLIETLAERIAIVALAHPITERVTVTVHKPAAPIAVPFSDVSVTIVRDRTHYPRRAS